MAILDIFEGVEIEPSAFEIALQQMTLFGLEKQIQETQDFDSAVLSTLGFKRDVNNELVRLTEEEQLAAFTPLERANFNILKSQAERIEKAFAGDLPVSEALKQRGEDQFRFLQEGQARRGNVITGTDLTSAVAFSTPGIQSLESVRREQRFLEDTERRDEINRGFSSFRSGLGLLTDINTRRLSELTAAPSRFNVGTGSGLLSNLSQQSLFAAQSQAGINQELADLLVGVGGQLLGPTITKGAGILASLIP